MYDFLFVTNSNSQPSDNSNPEAKALTAAQKLQNYYTTNKQLCNTTK